MSEKLQSRTSRQISTLSAKVYRRLNAYYRRWFQQRNHIYVHRGPYPPAEPSSFEIVRFERFDEIPPDIRASMAKRDGRETLDMHRSEMDDNATMWAAIVDRDAVGAAFTRRGRHFRQWFVELKDDDIVLFRLSTAPEFRGRGIAPALMREAMHKSLGQGGRAFIDCRIYNEASIRAIQKAGFTWIATMKPITRKQALGRA